MSDYSVYGWALIASFCAILAETMYRRTTLSWFDLLPILLGPAILCSYAISRLVRGSDSLLSAFIVFSMSNSIIRISIVLFYLKEHVSKGTWIAVGLLLCAQFCKWFIK